jgi:hypothetical protein
MDSISNVSKKINRPDVILFIVQVMLIFIVVCFSLINLTFEWGNVNLWTVLLTSLLGYIMPNPKIKVIGIRPGEKLHEELISSNDSNNTIELKDYFIILPHNELKTFVYYKKKFRGKLVKKDFSYQSNTNKKFLNISDLKKIVKELS